MEKSLSPLIPITCKSCGRRIGDIKMKEGIVSIVCPKCSTTNVIETKPKTESAKSASR